MIVRGTRGREAKGSHALVFTKEGSWSTQGASIFRASMLELGLLGLLVLVLVFCITLLRRHAPSPRDLDSL